MSDGTICLFTAKIVEDTGVHLLIKLGAEFGNKRTWILKDSVVSVRPGMVSGTVDITVYDWEFSS